MKMLTPQEVADILQVSYETALAFIRYSGVDYIKLERQYRVAEDKLFAFLHKNGQIHVDLSGL